MKRFVPLLFCTFIIIGLEFIGCSEKLNSLTGPNDGTDTVRIYLPGDTMYDTTITGTDTLIDTLVIPQDTVVVHDSTTIVDTVYLDSLNTNLTVCGQIRGPIKKIEWPLINTAGNYRIEISAVIEKKRSKQTLVINIDGIVYEKPLPHDITWVQNLTLRENSVITLSSGIPCARGHAISVCLTLTKQ